MGPAAAMFVSSKAMYILGLMLLQKPNLSCVEVHRSECYQELATGL